MCHSNLSAALHHTLDALTLEEVENLRIMEENRTLAADLFQLAAQLKEHEPDDLHDTDLRDRLNTAEADAREARRQYRFIKGVVGGVIAGSGIDWARDEQLRDLVLDAED
jgi:Centromere protein H (CENP-H)